MLGFRRDEARSRVTFDNGLFEQFTAAWAEQAPEVSQQSVALELCLERMAASSRQWVPLVERGVVGVRGRAGNGDGTGSLDRVALLHPLLETRLLLAALPEIRVMLHNHQALMLLSGPRTPILHRAFPTQALVPLKAVPQEARTREHDWFDDSASRAVGTGRLELGSGGEELH